MKKKPRRLAGKNAAIAAQRHSKGAYALKKRIRFKKLNMAKYISHLDLVRLFSRSINRAHLPIKYSNGFNPHPKMTFSLPLSVGVTSLCECVDIEFEDGLSDEYIFEKLKNSLPPDIVITGIGEINLNAADIVSAKYNITLYYGDMVSESDLLNIQEFFAQKEYTVLKKTKKKGECEVNLMDFIKQTSGYSACDDKIIFDMIISAGGRCNLKPEIAVNALSDFLKKNSFNRCESFDIERTNIYIQNGIGDIIEFE